MNIWHFLLIYFLIIKRRKPCLRHSSEMLALLDHFCLTCLHYHYTTKSYFHYSFSGRRESNLSKINGTIEIILLTKPSHDDSTCLEGTEIGIAKVVIFNQVILKHQHLLSTRKELLATCKLFDLYKRTGFLTPSVLMNIDTILYELCDFFNFSYVVAKIFQTISLKWNKYSIA